MLIQGTPEPDSRAKLSWFGQFLEVLRALQPYGSAYSIISGTVIMIAIIVAALLYTLGIYMPPIVHDILGIGFEKPSQITQDVPPAPANPPPPVAPSAQATVPDTVAGIPPIQKVPPTPPPTAFREGIVSPHITPGYITEYFGVHTDFQNKVLAESIVGKRIEVTGELANSTRNSLPSEGSYASATFKNDYSREYPLIVMLFGEEYGKILAAIPPKAVMTVEGVIMDVERYALSLRDCRIISVGGPIKAETTDGR